MTRHKYLSAAMALLLLGCTMPVSAQVIPGRWEKVDNLPAESEIIIKTRYGEVVECMYFSSDRETLLIVETGARGQRRILKSSVEKVTASKYDDRLTNGALIGLSAGAGFGALLASISRSASLGNSAGDRVLGAAVFGVLGMGVGALIDYEHRGREVLYEAPKKINS